MRTNLDCFPCFLRQALEAARMVTQNEAIQRKVLNSIFSFLSSVSACTTPVEIGHLVHLRVKSITGDFDPYKEAKRKQNELALRYESTLNVKCPVIAGDIHCNVGDLVLKAQSDHARSHH